MAKTAAKPKGFDLKAKVGPGSFKQPIWVWGVAALGGYYLYRRATQSKATGAEAPAASDYGYESATPAYDSQGAYASDGGGSAYDGGGASPSSIPLEYSGQPIPVKVTIRRPHRRHQRGPKQGHEGPRRTKHRTPESRPRARRLRHRPPGPPILG
jgi:hypothetical protein